MLLKIFVLISVPFVKSITGEVHFAHTSVTNIFVNNICTLHLGPEVVIIAVVT